MVRYLASLGLLFCFTCSALAQSNPVVAVLRDSEPSFSEADFNRDSAFLLDTQANVINVISGLGVSQTLSSQNTLRFDTVHRHIIVAENVRDRVSVFDYDGTSQLTIPIEDVTAVILTNDEKQIGCVVGNRIVELNEIDPRSIACATYQGNLKRILVVDGVAGNLVSFDSHGNLMGKVELSMQVVGFGEQSGLWVAGRKSVRRLDPTDLSVIAEHTFDHECDSVGLAVR